MYTIELTANQQVGYDDQAVKSGMSVQDNIQRIVGEYGEGYFKNIIQADVNAMIEKIIADPAAYKESIQDIYDAKVELVPVEEAAIVEEVIK